MEIHTPEIYDPSHLPPEEVDCIRRMALAKQAGIDNAIEDDPIARGLVHGFILQTLGDPLVETGYEGKPAAESKNESKKQLSPEQQDELLKTVKARFDAFPQLHKGIRWSDVEKSLRADPEAMRKLQALDEKGHEMNVFGEENGEIQFRSAQTDVTQIAPEHRTIMYDKKAQTDYPQYNVNGNAEDVAASMGAELADRELYERLRVEEGWVWLKTDAATRKTGGAFVGYRDGITQDRVYSHRDRGSFCAALRVKKA